ncbi:MAG: HD domain-containing protein, partial [Candidatus Latescibacteria bacterium]|nr:HD domain-containing protein [Candidatus Latescibacterota bacterium]
MVRMSHMLRSTEEFKQQAGASQQGETSRLPGVTPPPPGAPGQGGGAVDLESLAQLSSLLLPGGTQKAPPVPSAPQSEEKTMPPMPDQSPVDVRPTDPYVEVITCSEAVFRAIKDKQPVDTERIISAVREIVQHIKGTDDYLLRAIHEKRSEEYLAVHSTNVMIVALKIGEAMKYDNNKLFLLGVTALLHDLGMITVPERKGAFTDEDKALLRRHPEATREFIKGMGSAFAEIADIAAQEQ